MGVQRKKKKRAKKKARATFSFNDERVLKIFGLIFLFLGIYLTVAFSSYLFTWKADQDKVLLHSWSMLFNSEVTVQNWLGRLGAIVSNGFFYWGFGIPSVLFIFLTVRFGLSLIRRESLQDYLRLFTQVILITCFLSVIFEFVLHSSHFSWGGALGNAAYLWLSSFVGRVGLGLLFLLICLASLTWFINPSLELTGENMGGFKRFLPNVDLPSIDYFTSFGQSTKETRSKKRNNKTTKENKEEGSFDFVVDGALPLTNDETSKPGAIPKTDKAEGSLNSDTMEFNLPTSLTKPKKPNVLDSSSAELEIAMPAAGQEEAVETTTPKVKEGEPPLETVVHGADYSEKVLPIQQENPDDLEPYDPTKDLSSYVHPTLELLEDYADMKVEVDRAELEANKTQIIDTLMNYKIQIIKIRATIGPTVTLYEIVPAPGIKISKIKNLEDDIALSLAALGIRIIAPIPGKGTIGIEVPNKKKQVVSFKEVIQSDKFQNAKMSLPIALGKTIANEVFVADLAKMPHLLIAGATGQGKSVGINTILMSLLYKKHPSQVKLVLIDPKKVELFPYAQLEKHFLGFLPDVDEPIITDTSKVINTLNSLTIEMDTRYDLLKKARARNIKEYNEKFTKRKLNPNNGHKFLPFIVLVIDEFADLIMTAGKEVELPIARIAQLARAVGIHMIIATQRPTTNIITGMIKANFPARISFKVTSQIDSRTILDAKGAEQLIGRGDMLLNVGSDIIRLQCAFVDTPEVEKAIDFISEQRGYSIPYHLPEVKGEEDLSKDGSNLKYSDLDPMFEDAAKLIVGSQHGSTSSIQRKLSLGYNRAGRIMDQMEMLNIVGPSMGSKPREVMIFSESELMTYLDHLKNR